MFFKLIGAGLLCLGVAICEAQQQKVDSLREVLKRQSTEDTFRLNTLIALIRAIPASQQDVAMTTADEAISLAQKLKNDSKLGTAYLNKGILYYNSRDYEKFIELGKLAIAHLQKSNDRPALARAYWATGVGYSEWGKYYEAIEYVEKSIRIYEETGDRSKLAVSINSLGANYFQLSNYPKALDNYLVALNMHEAQNDSNSMAIAASNIGMIHKHLGRYSKALEYYEKGLLIYQLIKDKEYEARNLSMIGSAYDDSGATRKALEYYHRALAINKQEDFSWGIMSNHSNMGIAHLALNEFDSAIHNLGIALQLVKELNDQKNEAGAKTYYGLAIARAPDSILRKHHIPVASRLSIAERYLKESLAVNDEIEHIVGQMACLEGLAEVYKQQKNYPAALEATERLSVLKDSTFNAKNSIAIARSEMQFEQDKKDALVKAAHEAEIKQQEATRNFLLAGAALVLIAAILLFFSYKRRRDAVMKKNDAELKAQITDTEMKVMRLQMNPHFIFNSLNSVSDYILKNNPQEADAYLSKFAKVMRMTLEHSEQQSIPLVDDLKALELYMQLEAKRLNNKFTYEIRVADDIDQENTLVPPMIFQPFVENSIWHGISKKEGTGHIVIDIRKEGEMLNCLIDDDGVGRKQADMMKPAQVEKRQSLGMRITKARIEILNRLRGSNASVQLVDKPQGVTAELKLPVDTNF